MKIAFLCRKLKILELLTAFFRAQFTAEKKKLRIEDLQIFYCFSKHENKERREGRDVAVFVAIHICLLLKALCK